MGKVVVVNGFHRTGSTKCYFATQRILREAGIAFKATGANLDAVDAAIAAHLAAGGPEWLTIKSHRWMPVARDPRVVVFFTTRNLADVTRSLVGLKLRRGEFAGDSAGKERLDQFATQEILWQALFDRYCARFVPMVTVPYETYYEADGPFVRMLAEHMGVPLDDGAVARVAGEIAVAAVKDETDALPADYDPVTQYRRFHISERLGRPDGSLAGLPAGVRDALCIAPRPHTDRPAQDPPERQVIFQHLRKTGGTTLVALLQNFLPGAGIEPFHSHQGLADAEREAACLPFLHHHMSLLHLRSRHSFAFAFVRRPFARLLSERRQWMQAETHEIAAMEPELAAATLALRSLPMEQILARLFEFPALVYSFWNHQTLVLGGAPAIVRATGRRELSFHRHFPDGAAYCAWLARNRYTLLKEALAALRSLDYVGLYEDFETSTREVFARLGLPDPPLIPHLNARAHFPDEDDPALADAARPFTDLDEELYEEACELHAKAGRAARGAPADYLGRAVAAGEDRVFAACEPPGGHGWHEAALRADGRWSRWTGPGPDSAFGITLECGRYRVELSLFGAVSERAIRTLALSLDGAPLATAITAREDGSWIAAAEMSCAERGPRTLGITVTAAVGGHGVEVAALRVRSLAGGDGEAVVARAPAP